MNKTASIEWLTIAYHDLKSAQILFEANHFTDSIGNDLQQAIEKILKSIFAFKNKKIPKTHNLYELYILTEGLQLQENEINILDTATEYLKEDRYPNPNYILPPKKEIKGVMKFAEELFNIVCNMLGINKKEVIDN